MSRPSVEDPMNTEGSLLLPGVLMIYIGSTARIGTPSRSRTPEVVVNHPGIRSGSALVSSHDWPLGGAVAHEAHTRSGDDISMPIALQPGESTVHHDG
jgi:hypothetical protein